MTNSKSIVLLASFMALTAISAAAATTINDDNAFAYGANIGWLNLRGDVANGAAIGRFFSDGYIWSPAVGWIRMGSGTPANGWSYANDSATDWGVNHDQSGNLSGYAYGGNIGWVTFSHGHSDFEPRLDLTTGTLSGYVWGANVGWISLSNSQAFVQTDYLESGPDGSVSGVPLAWEAMMGSDLDGLSDHQVRQFYRWGSNPDTPNGVRITSISQPQPDRVRVAWNGRATRQFLLEKSPDLLDDEAWEADSVGILNGVDGTMARNMLFGDFTNRFFRVRPIVPLSP